MLGQSTPDIFILESYCVWYLVQGIVYSLLDKKKEADEQFEIYRSLVPKEFPQRGFLDDVVLAAKTETREQLEKEFKNEFSYKT